MIHMHNVGFQYGKTPLFKALDLDIKKGNIYGLLGINGAGKTTLLKLISGQLFPQEGEARVLGYNPVLRSSAMLEDLFHLPEEFFLPSMRGDQYLALYAPFYPKFDYEAFDRYCNDFDLDLNQKLHELSFGQKKKFLLSFGLASQTALVILDEPTNGLDIPSKSQFRRTVASAMTEERTFIISTHQVRDTENLIDPIIIIHAGNVVLDASLARLAEHFTIEVEKNEPSGSHIVYSEKIPTGWVTMQHRQEDSPETPIDLETLFNAVITNPLAFTSLMGENI